jgi:hypothetical protein
VLPAVRHERRRLHGQILRLPEPLPERDPREALRDLVAWLADGQPPITADEHERVKAEWPER